MSTQNKFFVVVGNKEVTSWNVHVDPPDYFPADCCYFGRTLSSVDALLGPRGLLFYMIWDLDQVPRCGRNVVVLLIGDERGQVPSFAQDVLAIFKTGALEPFRPYLRQRAGFALKVSDELRYLRDGALRSWRGQPSSLLKHNVFPVPLGYHKQSNVAFRRFEERSVDVFFAGGRGETFSALRPGTWVPRPRTLARNAMFRALDTLKCGHPSVTCQVLATGGASPLGPQAYSEHLMNAKISLCPRGNFVETFRLFESARAGCVIISEPLPPVWYFINLPAITLSDWSDAPVLISNILRSPSRLQELHHRTLAWWKNVAGEEALARYLVRMVEVTLAKMASTINYGGSDR